MIVEWNGDIGENKDRTIYARACGLVLLLLALTFAGYGQSRKWRVDILRVYSSEIEHWLLPSNSDSARTKLLAAFLVVPSFVDPDYSVCLIDSGKHFFLKVKLLDKNLWQELFTRFMQKQNLDLPLKCDVYSTPVSKQFKKKMISAFEKTTPRRTSLSSEVQYDGTSYEFRWVKKREMKVTKRSHDLGTESYEAGLVKILDQLCADIKNATFKESNFIGKFQ